MTAQPAEQPPIAPRAVQVVPPRNSRLERLHAEYPDAKAQADAANERLKQVTDGIKAELAAAAPDQGAVELVGGAGPALRMSYTESWRFDTKRFKAEDPETWVRFAKKGGSWSLKPVGGQGGGE